MLPTLLPGADRDSVLSAFLEIRNEARELRGSDASYYTTSNYKTNASDYLTRYLMWAAHAGHYLHGQVTHADIDRLVLTRAYERLLASPTTVDDQVLIELVSLELSQRIDALEAGITSLEGLRDSWSDYTHLVVPDTSFFIQHPDKVEDADFGFLIDVYRGPVHVLVPVVVVDELDRLKESKDRHARWRASYTLAVLDRVLPDPTNAGLLREVVKLPGRLTLNEITVQIMFDPPDHVRLPINDDEIVDRCLVIESQAGRKLGVRKVTLLTYDTGQSTRARAAGLVVKKLAHEFGDEPGT